MKNEAKIFLSMYNLIGESLIDITDRPSVVRNRFGRLMVELKNILASYKIEVEPVISYNTGRQFVAQMPPDCSECPVSIPCGVTYDSQHCHSILWRHFCHA